MEQLPPQTVRRAKTAEDDALEREKVALAKQRQDRLDRERLEKNVKYGLGLIGSLALTGAGLYHTGKKLDIAGKRLEQGNQQLALQSLNLEMGNRRTEQQVIQQNYRNTLDELRLELDRRGLQQRSEQNLAQNAIAGSRNQVSLLQTGAQLAGTAVRTAGQVYTSSPTFWNTVGAVLVAYLGTQGRGVMAPLGEAAGKEFVRGLAALVRSGAVEAGDQIRLVPGVGHVINSTISNLNEAADIWGYRYDVATKTWVAVKTIPGTIAGAPGQLWDYTWDKLEMSKQAHDQNVERIYQGVYDTLFKDSDKPIPSYKEWRKSQNFTSLRGGDPVYANTTGLQIPPNLIPDLPFNGTEIYTDVKTFFTPSGYAYDLDALVQENPWKWDQKVFDDLQNLPQTFVIEAFYKANMKSRPDTVGQRVNRKTRENMAKLWDLFHEYNV